MRRFMVLILAVLMLTIPVFAHPGDTDSKGGHYDYSTGEYHYHHGYEAHQHVDLDGDGDRDCPYDFDDQTGRNSGTSTGVSSDRSQPAWTEKQSDYRRGYEDGKKDGYNDGFDDGKTFGQTAAEKRGYEKGYVDGSTVWDERLVFAGGLILGLGFALFVWMRKDREIKEIEQRNLSISRTRRKAYESNLSEKDTTIATLQKKLATSMEEYRERLVTLSNALPEPNSQIQQEIEQTQIDIFMQIHDPRGVSCMKLPENVYISEGVLYSGVRTKDRPYGDLTVYTVGYGAKVYHARKGCSNAFHVENIYDVAGKLRPCARCALRVHAPNSKPEWYKVYERLKAGFYKQTHVSIDEIRAYARDHDVGEATALKLMNEARKQSGLEPFYYEGPRLWD